MGNVSEQHKKALAVGRTEGRTVRAYLDALSKPAKRGRPRSPQQMKKRIAELDKAIPTVEPIRRLGLIQERLNLQTALAAMNGQTSDAKAAAEAAFVEIAASFSSRRGVSWEAWREVGVPAEVLRRAGVPRSAAKAA